MSVIDNQGQRVPILVVDIRELRDHLRELEGQSQDQEGGYSEHFSWRKTDFAASVDSPVAASRQILGGDVRAVGGWAIAESTGAAIAAIRFHDGNSAGGEQFGRVNLQASESVRDWFPTHGIRCFTGRIFLEVVAGSVEGVLYWK